MMICPLGYQECFSAQDEILFICVSDDVESFLFNHGESRWSEAAYPNSHSKF